MDDLVFSLRHVGKRRPGKEGFCLHLEAFDLARGQLMALTGPSGCGKSTALDLLAAVLSPDLPDVPDVPAGAAVPADSPCFFFSPRPELREDVLDHWRHKATDRLAHLRLRHLGYVLQTGGLLPFLSTEENILLSCKSLGLMRQRRSAVDDLLQRLDIQHLRRQFPATLSVGERQRVAIARALAHGPAVVLADEPTAALDPCHARNVLDLFASLARDLGITILMVSHNAEMARLAGFSLVAVTVEARPEGSLARIRHSREYA